MRQSSGGPIIVQFSVLFAAFAESPISIILSHDELELNTVPGSGPGRLSALAVVGPQIIKPQSERTRIKSEVLQKTLTNSIFTPKRKLS